MEVQSDKGRRAGARWSWKDCIVCETSAMKWRLLASEQLATFLSMYRQEDYKKVLVLVAINKKGDIVIYMCFPGEGKEKSYK